MKWVYLTLLIMAGALAWLPMLLLDEQHVRSSDDEVISYDVYRAKIKSLDPATCGDTTSATLQGNFYESLYGYDYLKRPVAIVPVLADGMPEISADGLTYTIRIKKGIKYHRHECFGADETGALRTRTVRAEDFVLAMKRIADYHIATPLSLAFIEDKILGIQEFRDKTRGYQKGDFSRYDLPLDGVQAVDEHTLRIHLTAPFPQLVYVLAINNYAPVPREVVHYLLSTEITGDGTRRPIPPEKRSPEIHDYRSVVGTGAYYLDHYVDGGSIILRRNEDFRDEYYPAEGEASDAVEGLLADAGKKAPFVDVQYLNYVEEDNPMWMLFLTRQIDTARIPQEMYSQVVTPEKELTDSWAKQGIRLMKYTSPAVYWFGFNMEDRVLGSSKSLRQALSLAFNVEQYIDVLFNGRGIRAVNTIPNTFEAHSEAGPSAYAVFDLERAREKLAQAKEELIAAGVIGPGDRIPPLTLDLGGRDDFFRRMAEVTRGMFDKIGVELRIELNDWPTLQGKVHKKQVQIYSMGWHADYPDAENFLQLYYGPNIKRGTNNTNYSNPQFDALFEQAVVMPPSPRRTEIYAEMIRMLNEDCPVLLLSEPISFVLIHPWVHNVKPHPIGYGFAKYHRIDTEMRRKAGGL